MIINKYYIGLLIIFTLMFGSCSKSSDGLSSNAESQGKSGSIARMTIYNNYLYTVDHKTLKTFDISQAENMQETNQQDVGFNIETIFPFNEKLFIGSSNALFIYDISNPKKPVRQGAANHFRACDPVVTDGNYAFVTLRNNNLWCGGMQNLLNIYDISGGNILTPKLISSLNLPQPYGLSVIDNILYVCLGEQGLAIIDIVDKTKPVIKKIINLGKSYTDVIAYDDLLIAYVQGGFAIFDISDRNNPTLLSENKN